jgi:hypothetical protein
MKWFWEHDGIAREDVRHIRPIQGLQAILQFGKTGLEVRLMPGEGGEFVTHVLEKAFHTHVFVNGQHQHLLHIKNSPFTTVRLLHLLPSLYWPCIPRRVDGLARREFPGRD